MGHLVLYLPATFSYFRITSISQLLWFICYRRVKTASVGLERRVTHRNSTITREPESAGSNPWCWRRLISYFFETPWASNDINYKSQVYPHFTSACRQGRCEELWLEGRYGIFCQLDLQPKKNIYISSLKTLSTYRQLLKKRRL